MVRCSMLTVPVVLVLAVHVSMLTANGTEEKQKYDKCVADQKCTASPASCSSWDGKDFTALAMCRLNCHCACLSPPGPAGKLDSFAKWQKCSEDNKCEKTHDDCKAKCSTKDCKEACVLAQDKCMCLSQLHPERCSPVDASVLTGGTTGRRRRSASRAPEKLKKWKDCIEERQCPAVTCSECGTSSEDDEECERMCEKNCYCGCGGYPRGGMHSGLFDKCFTERRCWQKWSTCIESCGTEEEWCRDQCEMDYRTCNCECVQHAARPTNSSSSLSAAADIIETPSATTRRPLQ